jgi:hypothetical protein
VEIPIICKTVAVGLTAQSIRGELFAGKREEEPFSGIMPFLRVLSQGPIITVASSKFNMY